MLNSTTAYQNTITALNSQEELTLADEISKAERSIQNAYYAGFFETLYNARVVGNPAVDFVDSTAGLTAMQISFLDTLKGAGYKVFRDETTGWWKISWNQEGPEYSVTVYTVRTSLSPGAISTQTIARINTFFAEHDPTATSRTTLFDPPTSGGNVDETLFGATASTFYEYSILATQQDTLDYSSALKTSLTSAGLGYNSGNVMVWRVM